MLRLPEADVDLADIASRSRDEWHELSCILQELAKGGRGSSSLFSKSCRKLRDMEKHQTLADLIDEPIMVRACIYLWLEDTEFLKRNPVDAATLQQFDRIKTRIGYINLSNLIRIFFRYYDRCGSLDALSGFLLKHLSLLDSRRAIGDLIKLKTNKDYIFRTDGYRRVAAKAEKDGTELADTMLSLGIDETHEGRFKELVLGCYYITRLDTLEPDSSAEASLLSEISVVRMAETPYEGRLLGHTAIETLVENAYRRRIEIPEHWLQTILSIAGDPRVPQTSEPYRKWWVKITKDVVERVYERLSGFDLRLFLEILELHASSSGDDALARMFPKRRMFLEGLLKQNLVRRSRLFLSMGANDYLLRNYSRDKLPSYAKMNTRNISVIYLKLDGAHIIEGSHNYRFRIFSEMPDDAPPNNYGRPYFRINELRNLSGIWGVTHSGFWQGKVLEQLGRLKIKVNPEQVLDKQDYRRFRREYGIRR